MIPPVKANLPEVFLYCISIALINAIWFNYLDKSYILDLKSFYIALALH